MKPMRRRPRASPPLGAVGRCGDVADVGLGGGDVAAGEAVDDPREVDQRQRGRRLELPSRGECQQQVAERAAEL